MPKPPPLTIAQAARLLGVHDTTIRAAIERGELPALCAGCGMQFSNLQIHGLGKPHRCLVGPTWGKRYRVVIPHHLVEDYKVNAAQQRRRMRRPPNTVAS